MGWFMGSRISGFDDIHQGGGGKAGDVKRMGCFILLFQRFIPVTATRSKA
jgi:hypothetical protein